MRPLYQAPYVPQVQVYVQLEERLGLCDHYMVLNAVVQKIAANLKGYAANEHLVDRTLALFSVRAGWWAQ